MAEPAQDLPGRRVPGPDVLALLRRAVRVAPGTAAVVANNSDVVTYEALAVRIDAVARALRDAGADPRRPEAVAVVAEHDAEVSELYLGVMSAGQAAAPISSRNSDEGIVATADAAGARFGILAPSAARRLSSLAETSHATRWCRHGEYETLLGAVPDRDELVPAGTAMVCFTSGTTGTPKGVILTHTNLMAHALTAGLVYGLSDHDVHVNPMPLAHLAGASRVILALVTAGTHVVLPSASPAEVRDAVARWRGTHLMIVPTMAADLLEAGVDRDELSSLQLLIYGAAPMPLELATSLVAEMHCGLVNGYGLTESSALATALTASDHRNAIETHDTELMSSAGHPVPGIELRVVTADGHDAQPGERGEIALSGEKISPGYLRNQEATSKRFTPEGWLMTGDSGRLTSTGHVLVLGRLDEMIISGGINIYPQEVERATIAVPGIIECAAFGVGSARWGQEVHLAIVAAPDGSFSLESLRGVLRQRLDPYKVPKVLHLVPDLPKTSLGKVQRSLLAERVNDGRRPP